MTRVAAQRSNRAFFEAITTPEGTIDYIYACGSKVESMTKGGESVTWTYDGSLVTSETLAGTLNQILSITYNNDGDFLPDGFTYAGATEAYGYDNDNLLTTSGSYTINRKPENGLPDTVTGNDLALARTFNPYGENNGETFTVNGNVIGSWEVTHRDLSGRIIEKTETINGTTTTYGYSYDDNGRLETVDKNGTIVETYGYTNYPAGTCTQRTNTLRGITAEDLGYDEENRLLTAGSTSYTYDEDGYLTSKTNGAETTSYTYSSRGELLNVTLPDETLIEYVHDPLGRRIAKKVNGTIIEKYLWSGLTTLLAVYDGSDNLLMRFEYAGSRLPVAMTKNGMLYYFVYNQVGTLRAVSDASGNIVKQVEYDSWGYLLNDTNPTFKIPFGFAGGFHDRDTGLIRFGYRDYDPEVGRWTAKDPIGFDGGDTDLFGYCLSDPVNGIDPFGLDYLVYDGGRLTWVEEKQGQKGVVKSEARSWGANSGTIVPELGNRVQYAPIRPGIYYTSPKDKEKHPGEESSWGPFSYRLHESLITRYRNRMSGHDGGYHIHGGNRYGTAGCIEFTDYGPEQKDLKEFDLMMQKYGKKIRLIVK